MCILLTNDNELLVISGLAKAVATYLVTVTQAGLQALPLEIAAATMGSQTFFQLPSSLSQTVRRDRTRPMWASPQSQPEHLCFYVTFSDMIFFLRSYS